MATTQQSSFDFGLVLPLPERKSTDTAGKEPNRPERMQEAELASVLQEILQWKLVEPLDSRKSLEARWKSAAERVSYAAKELHKPLLSRIVPRDSAKLITENLSVMRLSLLESAAGIQNSRQLPCVEKGDAQVSTPRSFALASVYLRSTGYRFDEHGFARFMGAVQEKIAVQASEIWNLKPFLELMLLEQIGEEIARIADCAAKVFTAPDSSPAFDASRLSRVVNSLLCVTGVEWKAFFEDVCEMELILRTDPAGAYGKMDYETRQAYRAAVTDFAAHSAFTESEVARKAITLARLARRSPLSERARERRTHVGYYLVDAGKAALAKEIDYWPPLVTRIRDMVLRWPDLFYLTAIELITFGVMALLITLLHVTALGVLPVVLLILPAVECAVAAVNLLATRIFPPRKLPKLDFSKRIPRECATVVAVPTLLTSEEQVRLAVQGLEVRFLANRDAHLHFALVTDLPDSAQQFDEKDQLVGLCSGLVQELNEKHGREKRGAFFHFHRDRAYNPSEGVWMGWERKRGKLLDFNRFLLNQGDSFPVKTGDLSLLKNVRYVITLDLDTQLPPGAGHRLVGTLAHPLNRAVINPRSNAVVEGYGILQPRVDINLKSTNRSWFAKLLSGDTGVDIYTRAVSDVYQDLFGAAIFTGKGIYEVETFQKVLEQRFPCNLVLSHDLIEGEYAGTGLVSDVEVVDDYPSHYRAFSRRKHRWVRGDWQIIFALMPRFRSSSGQLVRNPLNHMSRWKIIDNLRRSLTECATLVALLYGWLVLPEAAVRWTLAAVAILLFPTYFPLIVAAVTAGRAWLRVEFWRSLWADFALANCRIFVRLAFLCHQSLIEVDAVVRSLARMKFTHKKLLQWETAADAELAGRGNGLVDVYLRWSLAVAVGIGLIVFVLHPHSLAIAAPFLLLWGTSFWTGEWLNRSPRGREGQLKAKDRKMIRHASLRTWRFFREFSNADENWLIPDIVQEAPPLIAHRVSPTNLGLLLNSRLAAHDLGFMTTAEFVQETEATLDTVRRMPKSGGHLYNWYENSTLEPVAPRFVSTVDNGNLLCGLWTLKQGCLEIIKQPLLRPAVWEGIRDHVDLLIDVCAQSGAESKVVSAVQDLKTRADELVSGELGRIEGLRAFAGDVMIVCDALTESEVTGEVAWWAKELSNRVTNLLKLLENLVPWLDPRYEEASPVPESEAKRLAEELTLESLPRLYRDICKRLEEASSHATHNDADACAAAKQLRAALQRSVEQSEEIANRLRGLARVAESMAEAMDFGVLYDSKKQLFSIGFDEDEGGISKYHYDLLASEARTAVFGAIAKGEVPQEAWFELKRSYRSYKRDDVLLSWSGTTFEYLMPCLWMKAYPNTLLERGVRVAIRAQQKFARGNGLPCWGISESSCHQRNPDGHYRYHAFGVPALALHKDDCSGDLVVAPYATFLALLFDTSNAVKNLRKMKELGWTSAYGYYEAADFTPRRVSKDGGHEIVRNWMAHHQGMCLVAAANVLCDSVMQRRFHAEPSVAATERLLHEKLPRAVPYEEEAQGISESAPALLSLVQQKLHPGFRDLLPKLLLTSNNS